MNPLTVAVQAVGLYVLTLLALSLGDPPVDWIVLGLVGTGLIVFLVFNASYARSLARMDSSLPWAGRRSARRARGDRIVGRVSLFGTLSLTVVSLLVSFGVLEPPHVSDVPGVITVTVVAAALAIFGSSLIDWYWVLPRRDGVLGPPPCHEDWARSRKLLTRDWLLHRIIAAGAFVVALIACLVGVLALIGHALPKTDYNALFISTVAVPVTIAAVPLVPWFRGMLSFLPLIGSNFSAGIGDFIDVGVEGSRQTVLVYDVSLDKGYGLIPVDRSRGGFTTQPADARISLTPTAYQGTRCSGLTCAGWDLLSPFDKGRRACDWGERRVADRGEPLSPAEGAAAPQPDKSVPSSSFLILR